MTKSPLINFVGTLPKINPEYIRCINIYLVRGSDVLARANVNENGTFALRFARQAALAGGQGLQAVVGPEGMEKHLGHLPNLQRVALNRAHLEKASSESPQTA
jgi:hypothetical protein